MVHYKSSKYFFNIFEFVFFEQNDLFHFRSLPANVGSQLIDNFD